MTKQPSMLWVSCTVGQTCCFSHAEAMKILKGPSVDSPKQVLGVCVSVSSRDPVSVTEFGPFSDGGSSTGSRKQGQINKLTDARVFRLVGQALGQWLRNTRLHVSTYAAGAARQRASKSATAFRAQRLSCVQSNVALWAQMNEIFTL